jgi:hypothetical protein
MISSSSIRNADVNHFLNVKELKKKKKQKPEKPLPKDNQPLILWMLYGTLGSSIFVFLAFINSRFLYLTPLGPIIGAISWLIRRFFRRHNIGDNHLIK